MNNSASDFSAPPVPPQQHIGWVDYLRITACFLVVLAHCCDPFVANFDNNKFEFLAGASWGSLVRCCVPLFVMISGALLLPIKMEMSDFYSRRMKRILIPLIIWSLVAPILYYLYFQTGIHSPNPGIEPGQFSLSATLYKMGTFIFNFNYDTTPLWYLYMLIGLYLFLPIINGWLKQAPQKDIKIFLGLWITSMFLPYVEMVAPLCGYTGNYGSMGILGNCFWNPYGTFYYFSGFLGYLVLAHYLVRFPTNRTWGQILAKAIPLFLLGYAFTLGAFLYTQKYFPGDYSKLEIVWYFSGINVFLMTYSIFIVFQKIKATPSPLITKIAALTFGVYLCHFVFVQITYDQTYPLLSSIIPAWLLIPVNALISFLIALFISWLLSLTKVTKKAIM